MTASGDAARGPTAGDVETSTALVGAPNTGKSVLFGRLTPEYVEVSNYPGTTVETTAAPLGSTRLIDTPGVHGISSFSEEERVTRRIVLRADAVVNVVDATQLDRDLFVTLQLLDMGVPTVVALNMMDEVEAEGLEIDADALERSLGVPVVPTVAVTGAGVDELRDRLPEASAPESTPVASYYGALPDGIDASRAEKTLLVEGDEPTARRVGARDLAADGGAAPLAAVGEREAVYRERRTRVRSIVETVERGSRRRLGERLGGLLMRPVTGVPIALALLFAVFYVMGVLVAQRVVDYAETVLFGRYYAPAVEAAVADLLPASGWARPVEFLLVNDSLGLLTVTVRYTLGVLLPLVVAFYLVIGTLEDAGVLPRLAVVTDRGLDRIGLNGRAVVPLIVGVGCVTMAVVSTRVVGSRRERLITTALLGLAIPCSAQIGVVAGLLAELGPVWWIGYLTLLLGVLGTVGVVLDRTLPGRQDALIEQLPRLRVPRPTNVARKTANRAGAFLREAAPLFGVTAAAVSTLDYLGALDAIVGALRPLTAALGLPASFGEVLVLGLIRRDFAAAGMTDLQLTASQTFVGLVVVTLFVPCILTMAMVLRERDARSAILVWVGSWVTAFVVGGAVSAALGVIT
ncbi:MULTISPECIES: ferrous iron transport protein B [Halorubrum]|uniref:Ferrous iron transport protein B n=1 Tax=Halorubrum tropicale TaxID=1765655 RepID=A0A0M9APJ8_9EURY|nr:MULTISPECIES: ferrous iron transport protein B [Halorubrum]KOX96257.1 GTP-binding protein [Halorubrum tropicale]TKX45717.1 ferrous iron transport protein B [Halorubrum sp. ARQ200]TKX63813.1 ferrous iron transport protein B [Halorubrum sp. ASP1]